MTMISGRRLLLLTSILIAVATSVTAQSGRRGPTKSPTPAPQPVPSPTEAQSKPTSPRIPLLVAVNEPSGFDRVPLGVAEAVLNTCMQRLGEAKEVAPTAAPRRMTHAEAVKAAKAERTRYVVWLKVGNEREDYGADMSGQDRLYVNYMIFEPETAKIKKSGRVHQAMMKVGNVGVSGPSVGSGVYSAYVIEETARQAAEKILEAFQVRLGGWPR